MTSMSEFQLGLSHAKMLVTLIETGPIKSQELTEVTIRNTLIEQGLASKIVLDGEDNFVAATHAGRLCYCKMIVGEDNLSRAIQLRRQRGEVIRLAK